MHIKLYTATMAAAAELRNRYELARRRIAAEDGISTLEVVVIALGLFLLAGALVAAITAAVNSRVSQIN